MIQKDIFGNSTEVKETKKLPFLNLDLTKKIIVSFSGGRTSAFMAKMLLENVPRENLFFIYANTGKENEETLEFINKCDKEWNLGIVWIEAVVVFEKQKGTIYKKVNFETASRKGEPFADVIKKYGLTNKDYPHCTRELKEVPIRKWVKDNFEKDNYQMAIGMRTDERKRVNYKKAPEENWIYPLVFDFPTNKEMVKSFWDNNSFDLQIQDYQGNCDLCWKKSLKKRLRILKEDPSKSEWWLNEELKDGEYTFDRDNLGVAKILKMSKEMNQREMNLIIEDKASCSCFS